jgi:hypothetical protein
VQNTDYFRQIFAAVIEVAKGLDYLEQIIMTDDYLPLKNYFLAWKYYHGNRFLVSPTQTFL